MDRLPDQYRERTLAQLRPGERAYTVPWAVTIDGSGRGWVNEEYPAYAEPGGTVQLPLIRQERGWVADLRGLDYRWQPTPTNASQLATGRVERFLTEGTPDPPTEHPTRRLPFLGRQG